MEVLAFLAFFIVFFLAVSFLAACNEDSLFDISVLVPITVVSFIISVISLAVHMGLTNLPSMIVTSNEPIVAREYNDIERIELFINEKDGEIGVWFYRKDEDKETGRSAWMPKYMAKRINATHKETSDYVLSLQGNKVLSCYRKE